MKILLLLDFDGDKCLIIINWEDGSFESEFVMSLLMPGYIVYDEGNSAPKVENNIENRVKYYVDLSTPNRTGQITNWATCVNDLMINAQANNDTRAFNWYKSVLVRLRFAQGWEIDLPKTGISADGPDGDMLPKTFCKPSTQPQWIFDKCVYEGKMPSMLETYKGISPMEQLHQYAETFWNQVSTGEIAKPNTMLEVIGVTLTEQERNTFEIVKNEVIELERLYRNETRNIMNLKINGVLSKEEQELMFEKLVDAHKDSLNSKLGGAVTSDVIAYACYYASNFRKDTDGNNGKVTGKRSYGWVCYYEETLALLYRNNNGMSLVALPDREMDSVEIINGDLLIDGKFIRTVEFPDGSYSIMDISGKPFIVVPKVLPVITAEEKRQYEIAYAEKKFTFECNAFTAYNQMLNSEDFVKAIEDNNNRFDVLLLSNGSVGICMNNLLYASIKECPTEIIGKRVTLQAHGALIFVPKTQRATTLMKNETHAYSKMLTFTVLIKTDETADMNVVIPATADVESNNDVAFYQESADCDYAALANQFGWND